MENVTIKVLRGFLFKGKAVAVGTLLEVPADVAGELVAMHKAEKYVPPPPRPSRKVEAAVKVEEPKNDQQ